MRTPINTLLAAGLLLAGALGARAQAPTGCTSTYTHAGTTAGGQAGLFAEYYAGAFHNQSGFDETKPNTFFTSTPGQAQVEAPLNYQNSPSTGYVAFPVTRPPAGGTDDVPTNFSARFRGSVYLRAGAAYTFYLSSDDASYMFVGKDATLANPTPSKAFIRNGGSHGITTVTGQFTAPTDGLYDVQILYGQGGGGSGLRFDYSGGPDNLTQQRVPQSALCAGPSGRDYSVNQVPSANSVTNAQLYANGSQATLSPGLSGTDLDGSIVSYTITSLPAQGQLLYNTSATGAAAYVAVSAPFTVAAADLGRLVYKTPTSGSGTYSFQYQVTDDQNATSPSAATYSLPVASATADLGTTLSAPATAPQGSLVYFTATVTNAGPDAAFDVATTIQLPTGLTGVSLSNSGTYASSTGKATFPAFTLGSGTSTTRSVAFSMPATAVTGTSTVASATFLDNNAGNNSGSAYTAPTQVADVSVAITGPVRVVTSQSITYTVVTTNLGPSAATGVAPAAQLATGLTGVVLSNGGAYNTTTGKATWPTVNSLAVGSFLAYTVKFNAGTAAGTTYTGVGSATSSTANGDPAAANNDGSQGQAQLTTQVISSAAATSECVNVESPDPGFVAVPNSYYPGVGTASAGQSQLTLGTLLAGGSQKPLATGDLVVIMQMQGAELNITDTDAYGDGVDGNSVAAGNLQNASFRAGLYEYGVVSSVSGSTLTLTTNLINTYVSADASSTQGQQRFQVIRVPRNGSLTLTGTVTAPRWNGRAGGVVVLDVNGTLNFNSQLIDVAGRGFRGGAGQQLGGAGGITLNSYRHSNTITTSANKGEGTAGTPRYVNDADNFAAYRANPTTTPLPYLDTQASGLLPGSVSDGYPGGDRARGAPGNAGGGGTDGNPGGNDQNTGGGGGANAGRGGKGGNGWNSNSPNGGYGGADFTQATPSRLVMGGGGGAGTTNNGTVADAGTYPGNAGVPANGFASSGAAGGGIVLVRASNVSGGGVINASGASVPYVPQNDASGGGGAGGSVLLLVNAANGNAGSSVLSGIQVLANGGTGGSNTGGGSPHGPGGGGAGGLIFASSTLKGNTASNPADNGTTYGFESYGSGVGAADQGQSQTGITRADVPNQISGCPADVVTTLASSASTNAPANTASPTTNVTFTLTATNVGPGTALNVVPTLTLTPGLPAAAYAFSNLSGGTYDPATGVVTFPTTATLGSGSGGNTLTYAVTFKMPAQTVIGAAASTADGDLDPRTANNDGTAPGARVRVEPVFNIAGRIFDDVNYGGGTGRPYATAETSAVNSGVAVGTDGSATGSAGTTVELYRADGTLAATTTSGPDGLYGFADIISSSGTSYTVRVVNATVQAARAASATGLLPVQTFRTSGGADDTERVGGEAPELVDAPANTGSQTLTELTPAGGSYLPQSITVVTFGTASEVKGVDFGYNFSTIVSTRDAGQGTLRQFIRNANALPNLTLSQTASSNSPSGTPAPAAGTETSLFMIPDGQPHQGLRAGLANQLAAKDGYPAGVASIRLNTAASGALPALTDERTVISGLTQTLNVGNTNTATDLGTGNTVGGSVAAATALGKVASPEVQLVGTPGSAGSDYGLTLAGSSQSVTGLAIYGFGNAAGNASGADLYVTGNAVTGTVVSGNVLGASATSWSDPGAGTRSPAHGLQLGAFASGTAVGGVAATISNNLIGFHGGSGIDNLASGSPTTLLIQNNEIRGNGQLTTTAAGLHLGNYGGAVKGNLVTANRGAGLDLQGSAGTATVSGNTISGNGLAGDATAGIRLAGTANVLSQNVINGNAGAGVLGMSGTSVSTISQNSIYGNGTLGIDLMSSTDDPQRGTSAYVSRNASGKSATSGGNGLQNFPILRQAVTYTIGGTNYLIVQGWAPAKGTVELFVADQGAGAFGQGKTYLATRVEGTTSGGNTLAAGQDYDARTGGYSGTINGLDQGSETSTSVFEFRIPVASLSSAVQTALSGGAAYLTATASTLSGANYATSEFSGNVLVKPNQPLPVVLAAFAAQAAGPDARLTWTTASEVNSAYFGVERSLDGLTFAEVARVTAQGNKATATSYAHRDAGAAGLLPASQPLYYRLHLVDLDGRDSYSPTQAVRFGGAAAGLTLSPNPTATAAVLDLGSRPAGTAYQVRVLDAVGRLVFSGPAGGGDALPLPAATWVPGTYLVQVSGDGFSQTLRLVRE